MVQLYKNKNVKVILEWKKSMIFNYKQINNISLSTEYLVNFINFNRLTTGYLSRVESNSYFRNFLEHFRLHNKQNMVGKHMKNVFSCINTEYTGQCTRKPWKNTEKSSISEHFRKCKIKDKPG